MTDTLTAPAPPITPEPPKKNDKLKWEARLRGETAITYPDGRREKLLTHPDDPDYGFYRIPNGDSFATVAYWYEPPGTLHCRINGRDVDDMVACEKWSWACDRPIGYDLFKSVNAGGEWPDLRDLFSNSKLALDDNSFEGLKDAIEDRKRDAEKAIKEADALTKAGKLPTASQADYAANVANALGKLRKRADNARLEEKRPILRKAEEVDEKWNPVLALAATYARLKMALQPYFDEMERIKQARIAAARAKAEQAARTGTDAEQEAAREELVEAESMRVTAGTVGRSIGNRGAKTTTMDDIRKVFEFFIEAPDVIEVLQKKCNAATKNGIPVPGTTVAGGKKAT